MANGEKLTWEQWKELTPDQRDWEHFSYHTRLEDRLHVLESGKVCRGLVQFFRLDDRRAGVLLSYLMIFKDICKP